MNPGDTFVHVFDPVAFDLVLAELDTISDFTRYLAKRAGFVRSGTFAGADGEEDLSGSTSRTSAPIRNTTSSDPMVLDGLPAIRCGYRRDIGNGSSSKPVSERRRPPTGPPTPGTS